MKRRLDSLIHSLVMIRLGQELGSDSELSQTIAHGIDSLVSLAARFFS